MRASGHSVQFYEQEAHLLDTLGMFIGAALREGEAGVVVATAAHREGLERRLQHDGLDLPAARASGQFVALDADETLSQFMVHGAPDSGRFAKVVGGLLKRAGRGRSGVRVFGEMAALLTAEGNGAAAVRLEELSNDLARTHAFSLLCAYPMDLFAGEALAEAFSSVSAAHSQVLPTESFTVLPSLDDQRRAIAALQQKAHWLEIEIAERKAAEARLQAALNAEQAARSAAEQALLLRDEFLSIASHELRTPVTSVWGFAQLLLRRLTHEGQLDHASLERGLRVITGQAAKLSVLIRQLLDVSQLDAGGLRLEQRPTDLRPLLEQVVVSAQERAAGHRITLEAPAFLYAQVDAAQLRQALTNLLDNAIKFSPEGGPIEVTLTPLGRTALELSVRDHGLGIAPERRGQIFDRYYRAHQDQHRSGFGLGLYLSRKIVELHGGEMRAEFPAAGGVRFVARLPAGLPEGAPAGAVR